MPLFASSQREKKLRNSNGKIDGKKLEKLDGLYRQLMFYVAFTVLHDISLAEDAVQQAFLRIMGHLEKITELESPQTKNFLVIIVKNISLTMYNSRRKKRKPSFDEVEGWTHAGHSDNVLERESVLHLEELMSHLPESYREALMLRYDNGYSAAEIGSLLAISEESVKKRLQRARARLAAQIAEEGAV